MMKRQALMIKVSQQMRRMMHFGLLVLTLGSLSGQWTGVSAQQISSKANPLQIEIYATAHQVSQFCADSASRTKVADQLKSIGASKIYLETYRSGHRVPESLLSDAKEQFEKVGFQVATGVTTTPGNGFGQASNNNRLFFNYESQTTRDLIKDLFEAMAGQFDEIMVDDFFLTDDTSEVSVEAKGDRSWSEYRLELMTQVSKDFAVGPAKAVNPKVSVTLKYPQWYERFHLYGYNVATQPEIFDRIWVGTETRNPDTPRFGFVQPTMGQMNFRWLSSLGGDKVQGAWFDPLDCHEEVYLMQAYQSVLAGAKHLTLFNLGEYMDGNPVLDEFRGRRDAVVQLHGIVGNLRPLGIAGFKPPNRDPGQDAYLFDFLSAVGLPLIPVGRLEGLDDFDSILLGAHAKGSPGLLNHLHNSSHREERILEWTPGFAPDHALDEVVSSSEFEIDGNRFKTREPYRFHMIHPPKGTEIIVSAEGENEETPVLMRDRTGGSLHGYLLNAFTYTEEDFDRVGEMFLPPSPIGIPHWPRAVADKVRGCFLPDSDVEVSTDPPFGWNVFEGGVFVLSNFGGGVKEVTLRCKKNGKELRLHPDFTHAEGVFLEKPKEGVQTLRIPGWEIAVLRIS
ncbi:MAG: hypothetical protein KC944_18590 [Candidatus Omnitrophica bacterium]|nr:hypothetical protein [Candidatus Omnitrophota bacterium]